MSMSAALKLLPPGPVEQAGSNIQPARHVKTRAGFRKVAHRAWDRVASEKNLPGFEHPHTLCFSVFVHGKKPRLCAAEASLSA